MALVHTIYGLLPREELDVHHEVCDDLTGRSVGIVWKKGYELVRRDALINSYGLRAGLVETEQGSIPRADLSLNESVEETEDHYILVHRWYHIPTGALVRTDRIQSALRPPTTEAH